VIRASFTVFSKTIFEKTAELCSGKGAALSLPLAAIPQKTNEKTARVYRSSEQPSGVTGSTYPDDPCSVFLFEKVGQIEKYCGIG